MKYISRLRNIFKKKSSSCKIPVYFVHIPKTAGTSFRLAADKYYGSSSICCDYGKSARETTEGLRKFFYEKKDFYEFFKYFYNAKYSMLCGHFPLKRYVIGFGIRNAVVFFRDPIRRMYSEYRHFVRKNKYDGPISDFLEGRSQINALSRKLNGVPIEAVGFCGITEAYKDSINLFNNAFSAGLSVYEINKGGRKASMEEVGRANQDRFNDLNAEDLSLYRYAKSLFEQRLDLFERGLPYAHAKLVSVSSGKVSGWAWWGKGEDCESSPVEIFVRVNGDIRGKVLSSDFRASLLRLSPPRLGHVGFSLPVDAKLGDKVDCVVEKTGQVFPLTPVTVH